MNIYIGYDTENKPVGILLAQNQQLASVVFDARNDSVIKVEEINPNAPNIGSNGVVYLLTSTDIPKHHICDNRRIEAVRIWQRGK